MAPSTVSSATAVAHIAKAETSDDVQVETAEAFSTEAYIDLEDRYAAPSLQSAPIVLSRGQGAHVWDVDGNRYLDFTSAFSVVNQGHSHPRVVAAMVSQCQRLALASRAFHNEWYPVLCRDVCRLLGYDLALPMSSGSEAVDLAIKVVRKWAYNVRGSHVEGEDNDDQGPLIVTVTGNYHGKSLGPLSASSNQSIRKGYGPYLPGVGPSVVDGLPVRFNNLADVERVFASHRGRRIAAVMVECVQGYAGCLPCDDEYLLRVRELCTQNGVLMVADEIQSGFGRTGYLMAYQKAGVRPDLVILGKALTAGMYAMGMVVGTKDVMGQLGKGEHSGTFSGNPLACAVAIEAIRVVQDERLPERSLRLGDELKRRLSGMRCPAGVSVRVVGRGLFCSLFVLHENWDETQKLALIKEKVTATRLTKLLRKRGLLTFGYGDRIRIAPPLVVDEEDLWEGVQLIEKSLNELIYLED